MRVDKNQQLQADTQGDYTFGSSDFSGTPTCSSSARQPYQQLQSLNTEHWINNTYSFYGRDNWRMLASL